MTYSVHSFILGYNWTASLSWSRSVFVAIEKKDVKE